MSQKDITKVYFNTSTEDREAIRNLIKANVSCEFIGPISEIRTPVLIFNSEKFQGLRGIEFFLNNLYKQTSDNSNK